MSDRGINWSDLDVMSDKGINWLGESGWAWKKVK